MTVTNKYIVVEEEKVKKFDTLGDAYRYSLENLSSREIYRRIEVKLVEKEIRE